MYNFWQFLHVTSAIVWAGGAVMTFFLSMRLNAARDNPMAGPASALMEKTAVPLFIVVSLSTLATGLVLAFGWVGFEPLWIQIGLGGITLSLVAGFGYFKPHGEKLEAAIAERGPADARVQAMIRQLQIVAAAELVVLAIVVWAMVVKPT